MGYSPWPFVERPRPYLGAPLHPECNLTSGLSLSHVLPSRSRVSCLSVVSVRPMLAAPLAVARSLLFDGPQTDSISDAGGTGQVRADRVGEIRAGDIGADEAGPGQVGADEDGTDQVGAVSLVVAVEVDVDQDGTGQVGLFEVCVTGQDGTG